MTPAPPTTVEEKLAQLLFVRIGSNLPPVRRVSQDEQRVADLLDACPIGGLLLFNGRWPEVRNALDRLQAKSQWPLLVTSDLERGAGQQIHGLSVFPHLRAFGELQSDRLQCVSQFAAATADEARAAGIHVLLAPVADVNTNAKNPIIATRAFGQSPELVAELTSTYIQSAQRHGGLCAAKHFPGHGDTHQDSHASLPTVSLSREELDRQELVPFRAAIREGVGMIMTAHVAYPALDDTGAPATVSKPILTGLLRNELGFDGVICSDSLLMAGLRDRFSCEGEAALAAIQAGVDLLLDVADPVYVVQYLLERLEEGVLSTDVVETAFQRVWRAKLKALAGNHAPSSSDHAPAQQLAQRVAKEAIKPWHSTVRSTKGCLNQEKTTTACLFKPFQTELDPPEQPLADALRGLCKELNYFEFGPEVDQREASQALASAQQSEQLLVATIVKPAAWHAFGLSQSHALLVDSLLAACQNNVLVSLGVPEALEQFPSADRRLCTFSDVPASQQAIACYLFQG